MVETIIVGVVLACFGAILVNGAVNWYDGWSHRRWQDRWNSMSSEERDEFWKSGRPIGDA